MSEMDRHHGMSRDDEAHFGEPTVIPDDAVVLRGAAPIVVRRRFWHYAGALCLVIFAAILVVSFISIANDNARIHRLRAHGIPVSVTITNCLGNIGGSGSNSAGYTCRGDYTIHAVTYHELIGSMTTFAATGSSVKGVVDPSNYGTVVLAGSVRTSSSSAWRDVTPSLLTLVLLSLSIGLWRSARRSGRSVLSTPT